ncbi:MAG: hypothetical protein IJT70_05685 [Clostridia bacterium]|nr:hypothetical protein [Clostridia bacterium]
MKRIIAIALAAVMLLAILASCGASPEGKYYIKEVGGKSVKDALMETLGGLTDAAIDEFLEQVGIDSIEEYMTIELKPGGKAVTQVAGESSSEGTWEQNGDKITINVNDEPVEFDFNGTTLVASIAGQEYVFSK